MEFVSKVLPHCHRWESFKLDTFCGDQYRPALAQITNLLKDLNLPRLQNASFIHPIEYEEGDEEIIHFYTSWNAPRLQSIYCGDMFPKANSTFRLKTVIIEVMRPGPGQGFEWTPQLLGEYLSEQPFVETLELGLTKDEAFDLSDFPLETFKIPTLRNLLFTDIQSAHASLETVSLILKCLETPALETLEIHISDEQLTTEDIYELFLGGEYSKLKSLLLHVGDINHNDAFKFEPLEVIFSQMRTLQHLKLESPDFRIGISAPNRNNPEAVAPPLRTVHLNDCKGVTGYGVMDLLKWIRDGKHWKDFKQMHVSRYPHVGALERNEKWTSFVWDKKLVLD
jgi:hypothetical protein